MLYGEIGPDASTKFVEKLNKITDDQITLRINSPGGDCFEGLAIMNALRAHPAQVTAVVESLAASAASFIAVGGADRVVMRPTAELMVHNALAMAVGNANEIDKLSGDLRRMSSKIATIYAERSGRDVGEWQSAMDAETWFTADEAVAAGLADAVEDGRVEREPVAAFAGIMNKFVGRRGSPPAALLTHPEGGERRDDMSLTNLAQELGWDAGELVAALTRLKNEAVAISGEVEVTYPADVKIVPTERIKVEPIVGDKPAEGAEGEEAAPVDESLVGAEPAGDSAAVTLAKQAGLTFAMGDIAEGFTAEVDEGGVVTITAPSGAEVGSTAAFTVVVNDTPVALSLVVRSLSDDQDADQVADPAGEPAPVAAPAANGSLVNKKILDLDTYAELKAAAQFGWSAMEAKKETDLVTEVDTWIKDGRISASLRSKAVAAIKRDPATARDLYGANPKNTIPRGEIGYGRDANAGETPNVPSAEALLELAKSRRSGAK